MSANRPQITKILTEDKDVNRIQDHLAATLNPVLKALPKNIPQNIGAKPAVTGSKGGNAALASLVSALASLGLIVDQTT